MSEVLLDWAITPNNSNMSDIRAMNCNYTALSRNGTFLEDFGTWAANGSTWDNIKEFFGGKLFCISNTVVVDGLFVMLFYLNIIYFIFLILFLLILSFSRFKKKKDIVKFLGQTIN
jgi:hypothetical protein